MSSNFRRHLLGLSLLVGVAVPWAATAQAPISNVGSGSVEDRVTQLERISNAHSQLLTQLQQQLSDNQRDIDSLRGQIQESQYQLNQVVERQKQIYQQIDGLSSQSSSTPTTDGTPAAAAGTDTGAANTAAPASTGDANTDYNAAVALVLEKKQYDQAISAFQAFVKKYPDSTYQPNANYWLGQLNYNKGKKDDAAYYFANVVKNYPKSPKSSEALLKVGVIMQEKGQADKAKAVYQQVVKMYPNTESAKQAQKRLAGS
ncbi:MULTISPECIES: cell division protein CpoB [Pectobacterium]|jgi:tol-pal system protein YbgF|uniref:Cell division coordinator CpoB n=3 Tax=Pectobacterium TaxID=122277 RepID=A0AAW3ST53_9GAMM|nr:MULTISPECIES: cell division protein CpoB [Pectobacterium]ACT12299.1 tol-pal system protein YbgF [Pectobacterium carotovorum subsp. carotovorum PC1]MBA0205290.1 cell division protein CpoB [Pectobacterium aroidearum]MBA0217516.1 cell division protein CpoB [Pectobacterium brasiliense]MBA5202792.1 cell division protein CpoB [Pectobacterium aroidearum]MBA5237917.1 cell division protein CpoB [Pectobacterium aroidearum]